MRRIGIVEDDEKLSAELKLFLEGNGYLAEVVGENDCTAERILAKEFHLLLLDIGLPRTDGVYLCREIRKRSELPIIMITSKDTELMELMSISSGADDFVTKPFHVQILLARMERLLKRAYQEHLGEEQMKLGEMHFDISKGIISTKDGITELTKNELKILSYLGKRANHIVSRDELMNYLWDSEMFVDDNTLTVNINRLRGKMGMIGVKKMIQTKRGLGYLLVCDI